MSETITPAMHSRETGSEETNPHLALAKTRDNYDSIKVALVENLAMRIAPDGYRLLFAPNGQRFYTYAHAGNRTFSLETKSRALGTLDWLVSEAKITPGTAMRLRDAISAWPEDAQTAWHMLNRGPASPLPPFAPVGMPPHI